MRIDNPTISNVSGSTTFSNNLTVSGVFAVSGHAYSSYTEVTVSGTTHTIDWSMGNCHGIDLEGASGNQTITLSNGVSGGSYVLKVIQGSTPRTVSFSPTPLYADGSAYVASTTNNAVDILYFTNLSNTYFCTFANGFA